MTTVTEPPLIDEPTIRVDELPALDQPDERVCDVRLESGDRCPNGADWIISSHCTHCGPSTGLICERCRPDLLALWRAKRHYGGDITVMRIEPIR